MAIGMAGLGYAAQQVAPAVVDVLVAREAVAAAVDRPDHDPEDGKLSKLAPTEFQPLPAIDSHESDTSSKSLAQVDTALTPSS